MEPADRLSLLWVWASISAASWVVPVAGNKTIPSTLSQKAWVETTQAMFVQSRVSMYTDVRHVSRKMESRVQGSQTTSLTSHPPAPRLSLSPPHNIFAPGEKVQLACSPPEGWRAKQFLFYKLTSDGKWDLQRQWGKDTWELEVSTALLEPKSTFVCTYNERNSTGELLQSTASNQCMVFTSELLPAALSLDPKYPVYFEGEGVTLTCSAPEDLQVSGYLFYKEEPDRSLRELPHTGQGPYEAFKVNQSTAGNYRCAYWIQLSGQRTQSPHSSLISVALTEPPRPPLFSVSPKQEVYRSGEFVSLTCLAPGSRHVSKITFLKDSRRLHVTRDNFTHPFRLLPQDGGWYSCKYRVVESEREIPSPTSNVVRISVMADTVPESSTAILAAHTYETIAGVTDSPGAPTSPALQVTSSLQPVVEENSHSAEPDGPATSLPRSSQPTSHDSISSSTDSQSTTKPRDSQGTTKPRDSRGTTKPRDSRGTTKPRDSRGTTKPLDSRGTTKPLDSRGTTKPLDSRGTTKPLDSRGTTKPLDSQGSGTTFTNRGDPRSTSQTRTVSEAGNGNGTPPPGESLDLPLVVGCSAAGVLLLVFLAYLFRRKLKGNSKRSSRSFWETPDHQQSRMTSRIKHPNRTHLDLQEMAKLQEADPDWRILPKSKAVSPRHGDPSKQNKADDDADSGAEFEFLDINPTYTLLGYPCSTFFQAESKPPARDTHIYEEPSR